MKFASKLIPGGPVHLCRRPLVFWRRTDIPNQFYTKFGAPRAISFAFMTLKP